MLTKVSPVLFRVTSLHVSLGLSWHFQLFLEGMG